MSTEIIKKIASARDLLKVLNTVPDRLLDLPIEGMTPDGMTGFEIALVEVLDIIEEGNRVQLIRFSGEEKL